MVHNFPPEHWAGTETYTYNLAKALKAMGHEVSVYCWEYDDVLNMKPYSSIEREYNGIQVHIVSRPRRINRMEYTNKLMEMDFREYIAKNRFDIVHITHLFGHSIGFVDIIKSNNIQIVLTIPDYWFICPTGHLMRDIRQINDLIDPNPPRCVIPVPKTCAICLTPQREEYLRARLKALIFARPRASEIRTAIKKGLWNIIRPDIEFAFQSVGTYEIKKRMKVIARAFSKIDVVIAPSNFAAKIYRKNNLCGKKLIVSDYGMVHFKTKKIKNEDRIIFAFIGTPARHKGLHVLTSAWAELQNRGLTDKAELRIYGNLYTDDIYCKVALGLLKTNGNVKIMGPFENIYLPKVMGETDVIIVPSIWYENSPLIIHEAYIAKKPVIASMLGGMKELIEHGNGAALGFKVGDSKDLADKMAMFIKDPNLVEEMGKRAPPIKDIKDNAKEMERIYRKIIKSGSQVRKV